MILWDDEMGSVRGIAEAETEQGGTLSARERYVADCARVNDAYSAGVLIRRGLARGWKLWLTPDGLVELWAPETAEGRPTSYTMRNEVMRRALLARGVRQLPLVRHWREHAIAEAARRHGLNL